MNEEIIHLLSSRLKKNPDQIQLNLVSRSHFHITKSPKLSFWVTIQDPHHQYFLSLYQVEDPNHWSFTDLETSNDILDSLNLKYSSYSKIREYFRMTYKGKLYDGALMNKEEGILIDQLFQPSSIPLLKKSLFAFGRGLAELHLKKTQLLDLPSKDFQIRIKIRLNICLKEFQKMNLSYSKEECSKIIDQLQKKANKTKIQCGIIHYDPLPNNLIYTPETDKLIWLDTERVSLSIDKKMGGIGPIALDYAKALLGIRERLAILNLSETLINHFIDPYQTMMGKNFPNLPDIQYYVFVTTFITLWFASIIDNPSDTQLKIKNYTRKELTTLINRYL